MDPTTAQTHAYTRSPFEGFWEAWRDSGFSYTAFFSDEYITNTFLGCDMSALRSAFVLDGRFAVSEEKHESEGDHLFRCELTNSDGQVCGSAFKDYRALKTHQRFANAQVYGLFRVEHVVTMTTECVICGTTFA